MIQGGTTTFCDMWYEVKPIIEAVKEAQMRAVIMHAINEEGEVAGAFHEGEELLQENTHDGLISFGLEAHSIYRNSGEHLAKVAELAKSIMLCLGYILLRLVKKDLIVKKNLAVCLSSIWKSIIFWGRGRFWYIQYG